MRRLIAIVALFMAIAPVSAQARNFSDLQTDLVAAPYRMAMAVAVADFHPLASLSASMRRGMASWDEFSLRVQDVAVIGWGRLVLGAEEVRATADRGLVAFVNRLFAEPLPHAAVPAAIGTAALAPSLPRTESRGRVEGPAFDSAARWMDDVERLFRSSP